MPLEAAEQMMGDPHREDDAGGEQQAGRRVMGEEMQRRPDAQQDDDGAQHVLRLAAALAVAARQFGVVRFPVAVRPLPAAAAVPVGFRHIGRKGVADADIVLGHGSFSLSIPMARDYTEGSSKINQ